MQTRIIQKFALRIPALLPFRCDTHRASPYITMVATPSTPSSAELERIHDIITTARRTTIRDQCVEDGTPAAAKRLSFASEGSPLVVTARPAARTTRAILDSDTDEQPMSASKPHAPESSDGAASSGDYHSAHSGDDLADVLHALTVQVCCIVKPQHMQVHAQDAQPTPSMRVPAPPCSPPTSHPVMDEDSDVQVVPRSTIRATRCVPTDGG